MRCSARCSEWQCERWRRAWGRSRKLFNSIHNFAELHPRRSPSSQIACVSDAQTSRTTISRSCTITIESLSCPFPALPRYRLHALHTHLSEHATPSQLRNPKLHFATTSTRRTPCRPSPPQGHRNDFSGKSDHFAFVSCLSDSSTLQSMLS